MPRLSKGQQKQREEIDVLTKKHEELLEKAIDSKNKLKRVTEENTMKVTTLSNARKQLNYMLEMNGREVRDEEKRMDDMAITGEDELYMLISSRDQ
jgi:hypothetical protein